MTIYACSFLEKDFPTIAWYSQTSEQLITLNLGPQAILSIGTAAEMIAKKVCISEGLSSLIETEEGKYVSQNARVNSMHYDKELINKTIFYDFKDIVTARNKLAHPEEDGEVKDYSKKARTAHKKLYEIAIWFCSKYCCTCNVKNQKYPGIIYKEEPVLADCASVASEESVSKSINPKMLMKKELTNFNEINKKEVAVIPPSKAHQLHRKELIQDMKKLTSHAEKGDLNKLTNIIKAMNTDLKYHNRIVTHPLIVEEMKKLENDLNSTECNNNELIASRIAKTAKKISSF